MIWNGREVSQHHGSLASGLRKQNVSMYGFGHKVLTKVRLLGSFNHSMISSDVLGTTIKKHTRTSLQTRSSC